MSHLEEFQCELVLLIDRIEVLCEAVGYAVQPTLILRHVEQGSDASMLLTKDSVKSVIDCLKALDNASEVNQISVNEAEARLSEVADED